MNKRILMLAISLLTIVMVVPIGTSFASKPMDVTADLEGVVEVLSSRIAGNNDIQEREFIGSFTSGNFEGDIYREVILKINQLLNSQNGPVFPYFEANARQTWYIENAVVTVDDIVAEGSFVMKAMGQVGNVKWTIISSDLTVGGEPVKMHGHGSVIVNFIIPIDPTHYLLGNTVVGQVSFS